MQDILLFPKPQQVQWGTGAFSMPAELGLNLPKELEQSYAFFGRFFRVPTSKNGTAVVFEKQQAMAKEAYQLVVAQDKVTVTYAQPQGAFYALVTLGQIVNQCAAEIPCCTITDAPALEVRGFMLDISRGKVPTLKDLCNLADRLAALKYNQLQLYIEGFSFAYPSFTKYWIDKTPITGEEIQYFDTYCKQRCIDLVPNQNSLGHMADWIAQDEFKELAVAEHGMEFFGQVTPVGTLNPEDPRSLELVTKLMDDLLPNFSSEIFNVDLDEPFELGQGRSKASADKIGVGKLYTNYLNQLYQVVSARNRKMYMWGDILSKFPESVADIPKDVTVLDWGYEDIYPFEERAAALQQSGLSFILCPGTAVWTSLTGRTDNMLECIRHAGEAAVKHGAKGVILTEWGDMGHVEYEPMNEAGLSYAAYCTWSGTSVEEQTLEAYMNRFVFADAAGVMGKLTLELGRYNRFEEFPMLNMTVARLALMMGIVPTAVWNGSLEVIAQQFAALSGEKLASTLTARFSNKKAFDYAGFCAHMDAMQALLEQSKMAGPHAQLVYEEYANTIRMVRFAGGIHYLNANQDTMQPDEKCEFVQQLCETGEQFIEKHMPLWVERNRLHGINGSVADFRKAVAQLKAYTA